MNGCFIIKVKKLKVPEKSLDGFLEKHPELDLGELQLMLHFRGQQFLLRTLKKDFFELNKIAENDDNASCGSHNNSIKSLNSKIKAAQQIEAKNGLTSTPERES